MIPDNDILINPTRLYRKIKEMLKVNIDDNNKINVKDFLQEFRNTKLWSLYFSSEHICEHIFKNGTKKGTICGTKIFITANNKLQKYLCSRHCRDYTPKSRVYNNINKRCIYIRSNGEKCKHKCNNGLTYCYIHKSNNNDTKVNNKNIKNLFIEKLNKRRLLYFKNKRNKYKKQFLYSQIFNEAETKKNKKLIYEAYKNYKQCIKYINYNSSYSLFDIT